MYFPMCVNLHIPMCVSMTNHFRTCVCVCMCVFLYASVLETNEGFYATFIEVRVALACSSLYAIINFLSALVAMESFSKSPMLSKRKNRWNRNF